MKQQAYLLFYVRSPASLPAQLNGAHSPPVRECCGARESSPVISAVTRRQ